MKGELVTYLLECSGGNYYVGKSTDVVRRLTKHFSGGASAWTKKHPPVSIMGIYRNVSEQDLYFIAKSLYGADCVRGAGNTRSK